MTRFATAALLAPAILFSAAAAQDVTNAYVQVHGGVFVPTGDTIELETFGPADEELTLDIDADPGVGFAVGGLIGYEIALGLSVEGEATFRSSDVSPDAAVPAIFPAPYSGDVETLAIMANAVYRVQVPFLAAPYVGAGAGYLTPMGDADGFDGGFAYQAKAGLAWPVGVGRILTEASYFSGELDSDAGVELDYGGVTGTLGYRFAF